MMIGFFFMLAAEFGPTSPTTMPVLNWQQSLSQMTRCYRELKDENERLRRELAIAEARIRDLENRVMVKK